MYRKELSQYMGCDSVCIEAKIIGKRVPYFNGKEKESFVNPENNLYAPIIIYKRPFEVQELNDDLITLIRPLRINGNDIKNIDHMWILYNIDAPISSRVEIRGHIVSYPQKEDGAPFDYGMKMYNWRPIS